MPCPQVRNKHPHMGMSESLMEASQNLARIFFEGFSLNVSERLKIILGKHKIMDY